MKDGAVVAVQSVLPCGEGCLGQREPVLLGSNGRYAEGPGSQLRNLGPLERIETELELDLRQQGPALDSSGLVLAVLHKRS